MDCSTSAPRADLPCDQEAIRLGTCFECDNGRRCCSTIKDQTSKRVGGGGARLAAGVGGPGGLEADV